MTLLREFNVFDVVIGQQVKRFENDDGMPMSALGQNPPWLSVGRSVRFTPNSTHRSERHEPLECARTHSRAYDDGSIFNRC